MCSLESGELPHGRLRFAISDFLCRGTNSAADTLGAEGIMRGAMAAQPDPYASSAIGVKKGIATLSLACNVIDPLQGAKD